MRKADFGNRETKINGEYFSYLRFSGYVLLLRENLKSLQKCLKRPQMKATSRLKN